MPPCNRWWWKFRLNKQAQHIEALMAAKSAEEEVRRQPAPQPSPSRRLRPWIEQPGLA
jgi:hypothetical protein